MKVVEIDMLTKQTNKKTQEQRALYFSEISLHLHPIKCDKATYLNYGSLHSFKSIV